MKTKDIFLLALYNIKQNPKGSIQLLIGVMISIIVLTGVLSYSFSLNEKISGSVIKNMSDCYFTYYIEHEDESTIFIEDRLTSELNARMIEYVKDTPGLSDITIRYLNPFGGTFYTEAMALDGFIAEYPFSQLVIDGEIFSFKKNNAVWNGANGSIEIIESDINTNAFSDSEIQSFCAKTGCESVYLYGSEFTDTDQLAIPSSVLAAFGVPESSYPDLIGKEISIVISDFKKEKKTTLIDRFKLIAIVDGLFYEDLPRITLSTNEVINYTAVTFWPDTPDEKKVKQLIADAEEEFDVHFNNSPQLDTLFLLNNQKEFTYRILFIVTSLIILAVFTNIVFYIFFFVSHNSFMYAMYMAIGMRKQQLTKLKIVETAIISSMATIVGIVVSYAMLTIISACINNVFFVNISIQPHNFITAAFLSFIIVTSLLTIILTIILKAVLFLKPIADTLKFYKK